MYLQNYFSVRTAGTITVVSGASCPRKSRRLEATETIVPPVIVPTFLRLFGLGALLFVFSPIHQDTSAQVAQYEWNITSRSGDWNDDFNWTNALGTPNGLNHVAIIEETYNENPFPRLTSDVVLRDLRVTNDGTLHNFDFEPFWEYRGGGHKLDVEGIFEVSEDGVFWGFGTGRPGWDIDAAGLFVSGGLLILQDAPLRIGQDGALIRSGASIGGSGEIFLDSDGVDLQMESADLLAFETSWKSGPSRLLIHGGPNAGRFDWDGGSQDRGHIRIDECLLDIQLDPGNDPFNGEIVIESYGGELHIASDWSLAAGLENKLDTIGPAIVSGGKFSLGGGRLYVGSYTVFESRFHADSGEISVGSRSGLVVGDGQIDGPNQSPADDVVLSFANESMFEVQGRFEIHREGRAFDWDGPHNNLRQIVSAPEKPGPIGDLVINAAAITNGFHGDIELEDGVLRLPHTNSWDLHGTMTLNDLYPHGSPILVGKKVRVFGSIITRGRSLGGFMDSAVEVVSGGQVNLERNSSLGFLKKFVLGNGSQFEISNGARARIWDTMHAQKGSQISGFGNLLIDYTCECLMENGGGAVDLHNRGFLDLSDRLLVTEFESFWQDEKAKLRLVLGPRSIARLPPPPTSHDVLAITKAATLDGKLVVDLQQGFTPKLGDSFEILTAKNVNGTFQDLLLPKLPSGLRWSIKYKRQTVTLYVGEE